MLPAPAAQDMHAAMQPGNSHRLDLCKPHSLHVRLLRLPPPQLQAMLNVMNRLAYPQNKALMAFTHFMVDFSYLHPALEIDN